MTSFVFIMDIARHIVPNAVSVHDYYVDMFVAACMVPSLHLETTCTLSKFNK